MMKNVIAIFDIGKTNKKVLLFDEALNLVYQQEQPFEEIVDEDGFSCDDIAKIETWIHAAIEAVISDGIYNIRAVNFTTYGATLIYLDEKGKRIAPAYNYLKPMPDKVLEGFYEKYGGVEEFSRCTASPALGMLNSGLQALWLKKVKPEVFAAVKTVLHLPQYLGYLLTGKITSEYTSIGCHTAMLDFDKGVYHQWLADEGIRLPEPESNFSFSDVALQGQTIKVGSGLHDSSASLIPYLLGTQEKFVLVSTGTWSIFMNPFNEEVLTMEQLKKDTLCYLSVFQKQVKSSRLFMGFMHEANAKRLAAYFGKTPDYFKQVKADTEILDRLMKNRAPLVFFVNGAPQDKADESVDLTQFITYEEAYHRLIIDLVRLSVESLALVENTDGSNKLLYITGGFSRNEIYTRLLATFFPHKKVYTSEIDNATALGGALLSAMALCEQEQPTINLGLKEVAPFLLHEKVN